MSTLAIEINDAGLIVADRERVLAAEPGYALVGKQGIVTGLEAYNQARVEPRNVSNRFWAELSLEAPAPGGARSLAELAYAQLESLWNRFRGEAEDAVLVVPGSYDGAQLGLLLGLADEIGMPVRAMVDVAVAASPRPYPERQLVYVDAGLHRVAVTPLEQTHEATVLEERYLESTGLVAVGDLFAKRIAEMFVLATRFDPLHRAECEQSLYDRLPEWLARLRDEPSAELELPFDGERFSVDVERAHLLGAASGFYKALLQLVAQAREPRASLVVQVSHRLAQLPGLLAELARLDDAVVVALDHGHAAQAALMSLDEIGPANGQVRYLRHLTWRSQPEELAAPAPAPAAAGGESRREAVPTHIVHRGIAYAVDGEGLLIGRSRIDGARRTIVIDDATGGVSRAHCEIGLRNGELRLRDLSSYGTFINEKRVSGEETLRPGDVIRIGSGVELHAIRVEPDDGA